MDIKRTTACALVAIAALSCSQAFAQSQTTAPAGRASSDARQEGIKVHGEWTLTVRNPDGTVAAVHEFKNALAITSGADARLALLLGGQLVPGKWLVHLDATKSFCGQPHQGSGGCQIAEGPTSFLVASNDLTRTVGESGPDAGKLVLRGSVRALFATSIVSVQTEMGFCPSSASPASCLNVGGGRVTTKTLDQVVPVAQDQLVEVKVVISFS